MQKTIRIAVIVVCVIFALAILPEILIGTFSTAAAHGIRALLATNAQDAELPKQVTVTIDGATATYTRGTAAYKQLLVLLRLRHSEEVVQTAGSYPSGARVPCGELMIRHLGLPYRCKLSRSTGNPNYLSIAIPYGNGRPGTAIPWIIDENRLGAFVQGH